MAWAPAVTWVSSLYEVFGRLFQMRGFVEEMAAGSATIMTAEFSGVNQTGMYLTGLTLEQASNGSPARGYSDGENSAWCIYTPEADFGNAEISELYYPILFLGRNVEPDSGGFGQFRGGLGHTAVWMVYNTPGLEYQCGDAGMRSKMVANHGMYGAYPVVPDRPGLRPRHQREGADRRPEAADPRRGDPDHPEVASPRSRRATCRTDAVAPFVTPEPLQDYDIIVHPIGGAQAMGDPIRAIRAVANDLDEGWTTERVAEDIYGVVTSKPNGSLHRRRGRHREEARRHPRRAQEAGRPLQGLVGEGARRRCRPRRTWTRRCSGCGRLPWSSRRSTPTSCGASGTSPPTSCSRRRGDRGRIPQSRHREADRRRAALARHPGHAEEPQGRRPLRQVRRDHAGARRLRRSDPAAAHAHALHRGHGRRDASSSASAVTGLRRLPRQLEALGADPRARRRGVSR